MNYIPYSRRNQPLSDTFIYEPISQRFKNQFILIVDSYFDTLEVKNFRTAIWENIYKTILIEHGKKELPRMGFHDTIFDRVVYYIDDLEDVSLTLDVFEFCSIYIKHAYELLVERRYADHSRIQAGKVIDNINKRFKENSLGYEIINHKIIKIGSNLLHSEVVRPVLQFIHQEEFKAVDDEYRLAYDHFRHGNYPDCLTNCGKAFESTMKIICTKKGWQFDPGKATAKDLLDICFENELIPKYLQQHYTSLRSALGSGVPTIRNKAGGHGAGAEVKVIPEYFASYMLHLTGTSIKLFTDAYQASL